MNTKRFFPFAAFAVLTMAACDSDYDLSKDINSDISVGHNFRIPAGKTDTIYLHRIITMSETVTDNDGVYEVTASGSTTSTVGPFDGVTIHGFAPTLSNVHVDVPSAADLPAGTPHEIGQIGSYGEYDIYEELPKEVDELYCVTFTGSQPVRTVLSIATSPLPQGVEAVILDNITMNFPPFVRLIDGTSSLNIGQLQLTNSNLSAIFYADVEQLVVLPEEQSQYITTGSNGRKYLKMTDRIQLTADLTMSLGGNIAAQQIEIEFEYRIGDEQDPEVEAVAGVFNTEANLSTDIELTDLPDFLSTGNTTLSAQEVYMYLDVLNPTGIPSSLDLEMTSIKQDQQNATSTPITLAPNVTNHLLLSNINTSAAGYSTIVNPELTSLFAFMPDRIGVASDDLTLRSADLTQLVSLGREYTVEAAYEAVVPFHFNNLRIEYTDAITDLYSDLEDVADKTDRLIVRATGVTNLKADLEAAVKLYDINGNELTGIDVNLDNFHLAAAKGGAESVNDLEIVLTERDGSNDLERLEKIVYTVYADAIDEITLRPRQFLLIKDIIVEIPDGINIIL